MTEVITPAPAKAPIKAAKAPKSFIVITTCNLYDPYEEIRFAADKETKVFEITNWMQCQIDADLMRIK